MCPCVRQLDVLLPQCMAAAVTQMSRFFRAVLAHCVCMACSTLRIMESSIGTCMQC